MRLMNIPRSKAQPNELQLNLSVSPKPVPQKPNGTLSRLNAMKARPNKVEALRQRAADDNELIKHGAQNHRCDEESITLVIVGENPIKEPTTETESVVEPQPEQPKDENAREMLIFNNAPQTVQLPEKKNKKNKKQKG